MTTFLLVRHASVDGLGVHLNGRHPGVHLNALGREEAQALSRRLAQVNCEAFYVSPIERTRETVQAILPENVQRAVIDPGLNEIDYGHWTLKNFQELATLPEWHRYNACRHTAEIPGGESMPQFRKRVAETAERIRAIHNGVVVLVTHADWIRAMAAHYTGATLDVFQKFQVQPASISVLRVHQWGGEVVRWNDTGPVGLVL